jgi:hypothetical protein
VEHQPAKLQVVERVAELVDGGLAPVGIHAGIADEAVRELIARLGDRVVRELVLGIVVTAALVQRRERYADVDARVVEAGDGGRGRRRVELERA